MASIKEAYDNTIGESFTGFKLLLWAVPLTYCIAVIQSGSLTFFSTCIVGAFAVLLAGFLTQVAHNAIIKTPVIVPGFNFASMAVEGLKTVCALAIYVAIGQVGASMVNSMITIPDNPVWTLTIHIMIWLLFISIPISVFVVYVRTLDLFSAMNLKKILQVWGEAFMMFSYLLVKFGIFATVVVGFITYLFWLFAGIDNILMSFIWSVAIMYNLTMMSNYLAQFSEEFFTFLDRKESETAQGVKLY